ncbi:MAG: hypothetical protein ACRDO2_09425, partial [Nocardioidaceae bacterium]
YGTTLREQRGAPPEYVPPGWDEWHASVDMAQRYYCPRLNNNGVIDTYPERYVTDVYTSMGTRLVRRATASNQPFFL